MAAAFGGTTDGSKQVVVTGYFVLLANLVQSVVSDQWICFAIATLGIFVAIWFTLGNVKLAMVALIPNTLPAMGVIAWLGLVGMKMNLGAALIAAVSIGISVDTSLHYLIHTTNARDEVGWAAEKHCLRPMKKSVPPSSYRLWPWFLDLEH